MLRAPEGADQPRRLTLQSRGLTSSLVTHLRQHQLRDLPRATHMEAGDATRGPVSVLCVSGLDKAGPHHPAPFPVSRQCVFPQILEVSQNVNPTVSSPA